ncbi:MULTISPECIES: efflux RND transporter periplasmic adaptor subunit [unclassified Duganella]|jgi:multidrug efflux system membrane fusion protein|uniref:efflux RND transporter periplasmic adaptor subunit n=1 Tax=unclassified Duganella TaxID=2636909 RepID=UPI00088971B4|nr:MULTISPECIES: efflux RND transporter periplasmic adaptor subunit [unclassified Duganella]SDH62551.1 RND family efflux transporter, MFP subunit [Duganella sp. OV458]SDJ41392.1 RND family efflux transporter, MFP subunit [Duganella sp. OV510]
MKKSSLASLIGAIVVVGGGIWYATHGGDHPPTGSKMNNNAPQGPTTVSIVAPKKQDVPVTLQANGTVTPISTVDLHPQTTSTIAKVHIKEGQFVKSGELMFTLDDRSERANLDKAQAQVERDRASLADYERQYQRATELLDKKFIAQGAVDTLKAQVDSARALLQADIAAVRSAGVDASYTAIRAPMNGRVGAINVYPGSLVQMTTLLTSVTQLDPITVAFTLPETALAGLMAAQREGAVPVQVTLDNSSVAVNGKLSFIDNTVDPVAGVIRVKAQFDNKDTSLWPGQYVNTKLISQVLKDATVIPQNAIISNTRGTFVYAVDKDHSAKVVNIKRLYAFGESAAVSGLNGDEQVIVDGKQNLRPGGKVRIAAADKPADAKADGPKQKG